MKKWFSLSALILGLICLTNIVYSQAPKANKTLIILYSNNLNGEIDPCPT